MNQGMTVGFDDRDNWCGSTVIVFDDQRIFAVNIVWDQHVFCDRTRLKIEGVIASTADTDIGCLHVDMIVTIATTKVVGRGINSRCQ